VLAAGWWSSPGALVFLTGIVTLSAAGVPLLLRPWMEGRLEGRRRVQEWRGEARALCVDLEEHLLRMERSTLLNMPTPVISTWEYGGLRRQTRAVVRFGPEDLRPVGFALLEAMNHLQREAIALCGLPRDSADDPRLEEPGKVYEGWCDRAAAALRGFETAIGGP